MLSNSSKANALDYFYRHIDENEWLAGVDLYQAGGIKEVEDYDGLLLGRISEGPRSQEVRLKVHPLGHQIQWIECTCRTHRIQNQYCEHMAALMLHLDREKPEFIAKLNSKMPIKPPIGQRKRKKSTPLDKHTQTTNPQNVPQKQKNLQSALLQQLHDHIHKAQLVDKGPEIQIEMEIKEGQVTHYTLDIDSAAEFLKKHKKKHSKILSPSLRDLQIYSQKAHLGILIQVNTQNQITIEPVVGLKHSQQSFKKLVHQKGLVGEPKKIIWIHPGNKRKSTVYVELFPWSKVSQYVGKQTFYLPKRGYWPLDKTTVTRQWEELPEQKVLNSDESATLIAQKFLPYTDFAPVFLDEQLKAVGLETPQLSEIKIKDIQDGWFYLDPQYKGKKATYKMTELLKAYHEHKLQFHRKNDTWVKIPRLIQEDFWELDESGRYLKVDTLGLLRLKAALGEYDAFAGSKKLLDTLRKRTEFHHDIKPPSLTASQLELRPYQQEGYQWLWWLYTNNLHGLLSDEMGLGKTHQAMALMTGIQKDLPQDEQLKCLVVCPTTVLDHWLDKIRQYAPNLKPFKHHGTDRNQNIKDALENHHTLITSYGILLRDYRLLKKYNWHALILDEAHFVKNNATATYQAACQINSRIRVCLTGTPIENNLWELKNIFDFLLPGYLGSDDYFKRQFAQPIVEEQDTAPESELQRLIHPFKLRRTKYQVLKELPEKIEDKRYCSLSNEQSQMYQEVLQLRGRPLLEQLTQDQAPIPYMHVFAILTLLKQICNHPALVAKTTDYKKYQSGKFELLKELLEEALDSQHKVVIYSQYLLMIEIISQYLKDQKIGHRVLTGQSRNRGQLIKQFQEDPNIKVFIGSLMAGGIGIDLTAASVVIHYDRWWNASKENQATDRVHRIGQNKNVQVLKLITRGTLEEKIDRMIQKKQALFEKFIEKDEELFKSFSRKDLIELLG